jgi:hypothetical protein
VEFADNHTTSNKGPLFVRLSRAELKRRVNGDLRLRYEHSGLTSFAGLELLRRFLNAADAREQARRLLTPALPGSDFGILAMTMVVLLLIIGGGRRLRHLGYLQWDPMVLRCCGLQRLPSDRAVSRWLGGFDQRALSALLGWNEAIVARAIDASGQKRLTIDVDGSVVSTGLTVKGARRGFNPHRRKVPSYYPITAYEANSGQLLRSMNRPGNVHDGKASLQFIDALEAQLERTGLRLGYRWEYRMDGAFFRADVIDRLDAQKAEYAIKVPFYRWLDLQSLIVAQQHWTAVGDALDCFETTLFVDTWQRQLRVAVYRKRVNHKTAKNYQLDLFDPDNGYYEYSAIVTNKHVTPRTLWHFMAGRGAHEKAYGELKSGFAFDCVPTHSYQANSAWQIFCLLAFNLTRGFQAATIAAPRRQNRKRRTTRRFLSIHTLRFRLLNRAGLIVSPNGRPTLDVGTAPDVRRNFEKIESALPNAA